MSEKLKSLGMVILLARLLLNFQSASENIPILSVTSIEPSPPVKLPVTCISKPICAGTTVEGNDTIKSTSIGK